MSYRRTHPRSEALLAEACKLSSKKLIGTYKKPACLKAQVYQMFNVFTYIIMQEEELGGRRNTLEQEISSAQKH